MRHRNGSSTSSPRFWPTTALAWFADVRSIERTASRPLRHYRVVTRVKPGGVRVLEVPKPRLREMQRRLLRHAVAPIPAHPGAHGCVPGRSVATAVAPHAGNGILVRADLEAFFPSIAAGRIYGILRSAGYPQAVAHAITGLCTTTLSWRAWREIPGSGESHRRLGQALATPHLPQGAPTSPALANLAAFHLDKRLTGLAARCGAMYTRYVDDLVFSGPTLHPRRLLDAVAGIAVDEGFRLVDRKSVVLSRAGRQQVPGAVVNDGVGAGSTRRRPAQGHPAQLRLHRVAGAGPGPKRARVPPASERANRVDQQPRSGAWAETAQSLRCRRLVE